ncbi:hypothetical protein ACTFIU_009637 [Dictyostelium citrinum]
MKLSNILLVIFLLSINIIKGSTTELNTHNLNIDDIEQDQDGGIGFDLPLTIESRYSVEFDRNIENGMMTLKPTQPSNYKRNPLSKNIDVDMQGNFYQINVNVLIGQQKFILQVDTGSTLTAIPLKGCNSCKDNRPIYDPALSPTSQLIPCSSDKCLGSGSASPSCKLHQNAKSTCDFIILYGDGSKIKGKVFSDEITMNGVSSIIYFGANVEEIGAFEYPRADGIMGLGRTSNNKNLVPTIFDSMVRANSSIKNIFGIYLDYHGQGYLSLGKINHHYYTGSIQYTPIQPAGPFYAIKPTSFRVDNTSFPANSMGQVIVDSGTSDLILTARVYDHLIQYFRKHYCHIDMVCNYPSIFSSRVCFEKEEDFASFPWLHFGFEGGVRIAIPPKNYMIKTESNQQGVYGYCWGIDRGDEMTILGDVFMRGYYTIFDNVENRVGFAIGKNSKNSNVGDITDINQFDPTYYRNDGNKQNNINYLSFSFISIILIINLILL